MAEEPLTISNLNPDELSKNYAYLRELGIRRAQDLAGKIWTDYNTSDPGVTILEVLAYAITDLGYRTSYEVKDLLASDPNNPASVELRNFYTAREIMHNCPVTINDYRKLMMDTSVLTDNANCPEVGIKNAWFDKEARPEVELYYHSAAHELAFTPDPDNPEEPPIDLKILYNVLIELDSCDAYGDLNSSRSGFEYIITSPDAPALTGTEIKAIIDFPRWDDPNLDLNADEATLRSQVKVFAENLVMDFGTLPPNHSVSYDINELGQIAITTIEIPGLDTPQTEAYRLDLETKLNEAYNVNTGNPVDAYMEKLVVIAALVEKARKALCANRNLCEDFVRFSNVKIEDIILCTEVELAASADVEKTHAAIYNEISKFLNPSVNFHSLDEMVDKGYTMDEIFEGPRLDHGFIDTADLEMADRRKVIHTSDLYQIIMDIPGVLAIKKLQIANAPQDNDANIPTQSVRWCLNLSVDYGYVPRLSLEKSKITFFKGLLPFQSDFEEVLTELDNLEADNRPRYATNPQLDINVPNGFYRNLDDYTSIQEEFPLVYGIGTDGLPASADALRKAQAKQMKGFLMVFDQILADYLSQLNHLRDLFAMNAERDPNGNYIVNRSYFTQPLFDIVPDVDPLYVDKAGHREALNRIAENDDLFATRRNKFLDHLLARFAESFADYTLMSYRIDRAATADELIADKLEFLNQYPALSEGRFKGPNHCDTCHTWDVDNVSGLNKRASLLSGMDPFGFENLHFTDNFIITDNSSTGDGPWTFTITDGLNDKFNPGVDDSGDPITFETENDVKEILESIIVAGTFVANYEVVTVAGNIHLALNCEGERIALSVDTYADEATAEAEISSFTTVLLDEFENNPQANRRNLACFFANYFEVTNVSSDMSGDFPEYTFDIAVYSEPFTYDSNNKLASATAIQSIDSKATFIDIIDGNHDDSDSINDFITVKGYQVDSFQAGQELVFLRSEKFDYGGSNLTINAVVPDGSNTRIEVDNLVLLSASATELGVVLLSTEEKSSERAAKKAMFNIARSGLSRSNYTLENLGSAFHFYLNTVVFNDSDIKLESTENDFNEDVQSTWLSAIDDGNIVYVNAGVSETASFTNITTANVTDDLIELQLTMSSGSIVNEMVGGTLKTTFEGTVIDVDPSAFTITVSGTAFGDKVLPGDTITMNGTTSNDGQFTINEVTTSGSDTVLQVDESIPADEDAGTVTFVKSFAVISVNESTPSITVRGGGGETAIQDMIAFFQNTFFNHEGMHIVDHILLRPRSVDLGYIPYGSQIFPTDITGGLAVFDIEADIKEYSLSNNTICVDASYLDTIVVSENQIEITDSAFNNGTYTIISWEINEIGQLCIRVLEKLEEDCISDGNLTFKKKIDIESIDAGSGEMVFKSETDNYDTQGALNWINAMLEDGHFGDEIPKDGFSKTLPLEEYKPFIEAGFYPNDVATCNPQVFIDIAFDQFITDYYSAKFKYWSFRLIITDDCGSNCIFLWALPETTEGVNPFFGVKKFTNMSEPMSSEETTLFKNKYQETLPEYSKNKELIIALANSPDVIGDPLGFTIGMQFEKEEKSTKGCTTCFVQQTCDAAKVPDTPFVIKDSLPDGIADGNYTTGPVKEEDADNMVRIGTVQKTVPDMLFGLPIPPPGCDSCQTIDPYSCILSVIVPYWQGRILDQNFRAFLEQTIRREAPAHIALSVCFIDCDQMGDFELAYKRWLLELARPIRDDSAYTDALTELVTVLQRLRNVYPPGTLHDCEETGEDFSSAIILNNSVIGNA